jgi:1,4-alpha-glucan branching enzyme
MVYAYSERFLLPLSHDEVAHGKKSLLSKMPADEWQKFANLRLLLSYQMCQPGKKLLFMGGELGVWEEWSLHQGLPWHITNYPTHNGIQKMVRELNHLYLRKKEFWEFDFDYRGFEWVDFSDHINSVLSYLRKSSTSCLLCVHHFTPEFFEKYFIKLTNIRKVKEIFNSDAKEYGGSGKLNGEPNVYEREGIEIQLAPLATMIFEVEYYWS